MVTSTTPNEMITDGHTLTFAPEAAPEAFQLPAQAT